jgi:hypothetical protein
MQHILLYLPNLCAVANQYHQNAASNHIWSIFRTAINLTS